MNALVFDIGGTNMRLGIIRSGRLGKPTIVPTPRRPQDGVRQLFALASSMASGVRIDAVVGGIAGPLDKKKGQLIASPHLPGWIRFPLHRQLRSQFHVPVQLENDSALVALGEAVDGAGKGSDIVGYISLGTGVGGARIVHQTIDSAAVGFEPGHHVIGWDAAGKMIEWEDAIGGKAIERTYGVQPSVLRDRKSWKTIASMVGIGLANVAVFWSPTVLILGGSVLKGLRPHLSVTRSVLRKTLSIFPNPPALRLAKLDDIGGLYGARHLFLQRKRS